MFCCVVFFLDLLIDCDFYLFMIILSCFAILYFLYFLTHFFLPFLFVTFLFLLSFF